MGKGDAWPALREKMLEADIVIIATMAAAGAAHHPAKPLTATPYPGTKK